MKFIKFKNKLGKHLKEVYAQYADTGIINTQIKKIDLNFLYFNIEFKLNNLHKYCKNNFELFSDEKKRLLKLRRELKENLPSFERPQSKNYKRVSSSWRKPVGSQNKVRKGLKQKMSLVKLGYGKPAAVRNCDSKGYDIFLIKTLIDLNNYISFENNLNNTKQTSMPILSSKLGLKKRIEFENKIFENKYIVSNPVELFEKDQIIIEK